MIAFGEVEPSDRVVAFGHHNLERRERPTTHVQSCEYLGGDIYRRICNLHSRELIALDAVLIEPDSRLCWFWKRCEKLEITMKQFGQLDYRKLFFSFRIQENNLLVFSRFQIEPHSSVVIFM